MSNNSYYSNTLHLHGFKSCSSPEVSLLKSAHVQSRQKFSRDLLDDSEEAWEVMWSNDNDSKHMAHGTKEWPVQPQNITALEKICKNRLENQKPGQDMQETFTSVIANQSFEVNF